MVVAQGDIYWADLPEPVGSEAGFRRPVVVVQGDALNSSKIGTVICIPMTSNMRFADVPGNVLLLRGKSGLPKDSVANAAQIVALDRTLLGERVGHIGRRDVQSIFEALDEVLGR